MMKKVFIFIFIFSYIFSAEVKAEVISERLAGRILLQVENSGEAWYVHPSNNSRYFLGRPNDAFEIMRSQGVGITNLDLIKIEVGILNDMPKLDIFIDTDQDGYSDDEEISNGYNPYGDGKLKYDLGFSRNNVGKIFLQVEQNGEAWYVNPVDNKRYFLGKPKDAFNVMRFLGLGISNEDLEKIKIFGSSYLINSTEKAIHDKINNERAKNGLKVLKWNEKVASVAREHSENLANENKAFALSLGHRCDAPLVHHEGFDFGLHQDERLYNRDIHYFEMSGENIALVSSARFNIQHDKGDGTKEKLDECSELKVKYYTEFHNKLYSNTSSEQKVKYINDEIAKRKKLYDTYYFETVEVFWIDEDELVKTVVDGWMNSPGHRKNILTTEFDEEGIGAVYTEGGYLIVTQVFIMKADCGYKDGACCEKAGYQPHCFEGLECEYSKICK
ncbi:CAP domain-containing protein [Candidatus Parcubacteria bacterium]|nr:CAP domain-containing protein [Candidatus Parcubacteria bacterium]